VSRGVSGFVFGSISRGARIVAALLFAAAFVVLFLDFFLLFGA